MVCILLFSRRCCQHWLCAVLLLISIQGFAHPAHQFKECTDRADYQVRCDTNGTKVICTVEDSSGFVWEIRHYRSGFKWGSWQYFDAKGEMIKQVHYKKDVRIWTYTYREGEIIESVNKKGKIKKFKGCGC